MIFQAYFYEWILTTNQHWFREAHDTHKPNRLQDIILASDCLIYWHIHVSLGIDDLNQSNKRGKAGLDIFRTSRLIP